MSCGSGVPTFIVSGQPLAAQVNEIQNTKYQTIQTHPA
jgi:hypothetical protein